MRAQTQGTVQRDTYTLIDYLPTPFDPHQPHNLTPIFTLSLFSAEQILLSQRLTKGRMPEIGKHVLKDRFPRKVIKM